MLSSESLLIRVHPTTGVVIPFESIPQATIRLQWLARPHGKHRGAYQIVYSSGMASSIDPDSIYVKRIHGIAMVITWMFLFPSSIFFTRYFRSVTPWMRVHIFINSTGAIFGAFASTIYVINSLSNNFARNPHTSLIFRPHSILGLCLIAGVFMQGVLGIANRYYLKQTRLVSTDLASALFARKSASRCKLPLCVLHRSWINSHPGGQLILHSVAGTDITNDYFSEAGYDADAFVPSPAVKVRSLSGPNVRQLPRNDTERYAESIMYLRTQESLSTLQNYFGTDQIPLYPPSSRSSIASQRHMVDEKEWQYIGPTAVDGDADISSKVMLALSLRRTIWESQNTFFPGQSIELQARVNGNFISRFYTPIKGNPTCFEIFVKMYPSGGIVSPFLSRQKLGELLIGEGSGLVASIQVYPDTSLLPTLTPISVWQAYESTDPDELTLRHIQITHCFSRGGVSDGQTMDISLGEAVQGRISPYVINQASPVRTMEASTAWGQASSLVICGSKVLQGDIYDMACSSCGVEYNDVVILSDDISA
ncbi:hypothetical protein BASA60_006952 [Batrachochytrium salamandrivorans]|nr:hypothetical protein BASA60_006952 [Batrachochytrium salamandrivorans]